jgi:hypothetical protein
MADGKDVRTATTKPAFNRGEHIAGTLFGTLPIAAIVATDNRLKRGASGFLLPAAPAAVATVENALNANKKSGQLLVADALVAITGIAISKWLK